jgi:hypothetical protein
MQSEFHIPQDCGNHRIRFEENLLPVESQHDESETGEAGIPPQVPKTLFATSVVLFAVALDDQSIADKQVHPFEVSKRDAHLGDRRASRPGKKNPDHTFRTGIRALVDQRNECSPGGRESGSSEFQVEAGGVRATKERVQHRDDVFFRLGCDELPEHVGDGCDAECVAERSGAARPEDPDILTVAIE